MQQTRTTQPIRQAQQAKRTLHVSLGQVGRNLDQQRRWPRSPLPLHAITRLFWGGWMGWGAGLRERVVLSTGKQAGGRQGQQATRRGLLMAAR